MQGHDAAGEIDEAILSRCAELGLTSARAMRLAAAANPPSLTWVLGLDVATLKPLKARRWLWMAAQTSSVSYRDLLTPESLLQILVTGDIPAPLISHVCHFLDETPLQVVTMAIEQASRESGVPIDLIWLKFEEIAIQIGSKRMEAWKTED